MIQTIWDLGKDSVFRLKSGQNCRVLTPTQDGKGLTAEYLDGELMGQPDFVFEEEIDFERSAPPESS
jgi:hypothetical protein